MLVWLGQIASTNARAIERILVAADTRCPARIQIASGAIAEIAGVCGKRASAIHGDAEARRFQIEIRGGCSVGGPNVKPIKLGPDAIRYQTADQSGVGRYLRTGKATCASNKSAGLRTSAGQEGRFNRAISR